MAKFCLRCVQLIHKHNQYLTGIQIGFGTKIGKALMFPHYSCIVINGSAIIGDNCTIYHGVTVGSVRGPKGGAPHIGNNVVIASGAKVIGKIQKMRKSHNHSSNSMMRLLNFPPYV